MSFVSLARNLSSRWERSEAWVSFWARPRGRDDVRMTYLLDGEDGDEDGDEVESEAVVELLDPDYTSVKTEKGSTISNGGGSTEFDLSN